MVNSLVLVKVAFLFINLPLKPLLLKLPTPLFVDKKQSCIVEGFTLMPRSLTDLITTWFFSLNSRSFFFCSLHSDDSSENCLTKSFEEMSILIKAILNFSCFVAAINFSNITLLWLARNEALNED